MDTQTFNILYKETEQALLDNRVKDALTGLKGMLYDADNYMLICEFESIQNDYNMMLQFMTTGGNDPKRGEILKNIMQRIFTLLDRSKRNFRLKAGRDLFAQTLRRLHNEEADDITILRSKVDEQCMRLYETRNRRSYNGQAQDISNLECEIFTTYDQLFNNIWTSDILKNDEATNFKALIEEQEEEHRPLLISAVMLSLWEAFDANKFRILLHFCEDEHQETRTRALTATVWVYIKYYAKFQHHDDLLLGLSLWKQNPTIVRELSLLQKQLFLSLETARAEKKMQDEILPDLMKSKRYQRTKLGFEEIDTDLANALNGTSGNTDKLSKEDKRLAQNMQKIMKMIQKGIDVNWATFSALKTYPFFRELSHWFVPFNTRHTEVRSIFYSEKEHLNPMRSVMLENGNFCDSDKYSLCLMLQQIMPEQRNLIFEQFNPKMDGEEGESLLNNLTARTKTPEDIYRSHLEDLYRFFKLFAYRSEFTDAFSFDVLFANYSHLDEIVSTSAYMHDMAKFLTNLGYYNDAILYWERIQKLEGANGELLQQLALCHSKNRNLSKAIICLQQADLLTPDNEWILNHLQNCYSELGRFDMALPCLLKLEQMNPDNHHIISETGFCLMQLNRFEEAANRFYKLEYMEQRILQAQRAIAWCALKMNKLEQAEKYYKKITEESGKAKWEDYLNAGHTAWMQGNLPKAITFYRQYVELYLKQNPSKNDWLAAFNDDIPELISHGISRHDICLVRDMLYPNEMN